MDFEEMWWGYKLEYERSLMAQTLLLELRAWRSRDVLQGADFHFDTDQYSS
jgi:hypothetical protein